MVIRLLLLIFLLLCGKLIFAQVVTECPQNIGFETGTFTNWETYTGYITETQRNAINAPPPTINVSPTQPIYNRHTLIKRGSAVDPFGGFSLNSPNGSDYVIKLGNSSGGHEAERISYTLNVPANVEAYSIIFNYAVVLENPNHAYEQQPKFTCQVIDLSTNTSTDCGSFEFIAPGSGGSIPGFSSSPLSDSVLYKPWSPVMVNLSDYLGKTIRLEFTTNDCSFNKHFGYAYIDFNENCSIPVIGNITCPENDEIILKVITGMEGYRWFNSATNQDLGYSENLRLSPVPPAGTKIGVELTPYSGLGCSQTLYTTITNMYMNLKDPPEKCTSIDITSPSLTVGNSSDLTYSYWKDENATIPVQDPKHVTVDGIYYIKGESSSKCILVLPINVVITRLQPIEVMPPETVYYPQTVDITKAFVRQKGLSYSFFRNQALTVPLKNPEAVNRSGRYYVRGYTTDGCDVTAPIDVTVILPDFFIPNTFTPNGDGINDLFLVLTNQPQAIKSLRIFNRWGDVVYQTTDINRYWDGKKDDKSVPVGVYYWIIEGDEKLKGFKKSGYVMVMR